jgi:hypothetical protein
VSNGVAAMKFCKQEQQRLSDKVFEQENLGVD